MKYAGNLLIANPSNPIDELSRSVILLVTHTDSVAVGLQINLKSNETDLDNVAQNIGIPLHTNDSLYYGGNMSPNKIHVIHSLDWQGISTVKLTKEIGITNDISILTALGQGQGPRYYKACAGYYFWADGRLDQQLSRKNREIHEPHKWEIISANIDTVFDDDVENMWQNSLKQLTRQKINDWF